MSEKIKVLVVDDSALVREILTRGLSMDPAIEVVGAASDPYGARDQIMAHNPDVLTLDVEMPRMDGVEFLRRLMPQRPLPVLMVSSLTERGKEITLRALQAGAVDFVTKPKTDVAAGLNGMLAELRQKVKIAAKANVQSWKQPHYHSPAGKGLSRCSVSQSSDTVIAIGASTGGTEAIRRILASLPADIPGAVIVQHMPPGFTSLFAESLDKMSVVTVKEAGTGDRILRGQVLIAPGDRHIQVVRSGTTYLVKCFEGDKVCGHRPSVEVLFRSVAQNVGANAIGVMLTGMGHDGADGMLAMKKAGAKTLAQDEKTSVVFGMPRAAYECGGAEMLVPLPLIAQRITRLLSEMTR